MSQPETIELTDELVAIVKNAIESALAYERATGGSRKLGITGEVGEILACYELSLDLVVDPRTEGYDALDKDRMRVQIKTRRSETSDMPKMMGRTSKFSEHEFDYALLVLLKQNHEISSIWRADYEQLLPHIEKEERRNPNLNTFKSVGNKIYPL